MTKVKAPAGNRVFHEIWRDFSWEGFHKLNVTDAFVEIGYSKSEIKRLLKNNAIKVWDTRVVGDKMEWYKRSVELVELVEPDEVFMFGRFKFLFVSPIPFKWYQKLYYKLRELKEMIWDR